MTLPVNLKIISSMTDGENSDQFEMEMTGERTEEPEGFSVHYILPETGGKVQCDLLVRRGRVEILNHGDLESRLILEPGVRKLFPYQTPYGNLVMEVVTDILEMPETFNRQEMEIRATYRLFSGRNHLSSHEVHIIISE